VVSSQRKTKADTLRRSPGRPAGGNGSNRKSELLQAAIVLFGARGFDGVSLSQIAQRAGSDVGLTRYYFGSKAKLWEAAMEHLAERFAETLALSSRLEDRLTKTEALKIAIRGFIAASAAWPQVSRIIVFDGDKNDPRGKFIAKRFVTPFFVFLADLIAGAKTEGTIPTVSDRTLFFMITHGASFPMALPILTNALPGGDINSPAALEAHAEAIIDLLFSQR